MSKHNTTDKTRRWEFIICPNIGFLASPEPLIKDCELKISFDRSAAYNSLLVIDDAKAKPLDKPIEIKDCVAITEYISSESLISYFDRIEYEPIIYEYDDCDVLVKTIPTAETEIRFANIKGGNTPQAMFAAIIPQACLQGDKTRSSTFFQCNKVEEMNFTLNGSSLNGFPIAIRDQSCFSPMQKFCDTTDKYYNVMSSETFSMTEFEYNFLWSHKFEGESSSQGWLGINFKLTAPFTETMCLVVWIISPTATSIDKYHKIERINL